MKNRISIIGISLTLMLITSCKKQEVTKSISIIPKPVLIEMHKGVFSLTDNFSISASGELQNELNFLQYAISTRTRLQSHGVEEKAEITLRLSEDIKQKEGYTLTISPKEINIAGKTPQGILCGIQTLLQIIPAEKKNSYALPCLHITDYPAFAWRGMHLDVSRHFYSVEEVKKYIDILAMHKLNVFHWHLVDDQGWRIEIKKYPKLTEVGAWREDREGEIWAIDDDQRLPYDENKPYYGGFYTQDDIKEIVAYATAKHITIVPEIEMPGHSRAALVAYPEMSCFGKETKVPSAGFVGENWDFSDPFCAGKDESFEFLQDILDEIMVLFPSEYIHIGGDECTKRCWKKCEQCQARIKKEGLKDEFELQSYFIKRIEEYLTSKNRKLIGWQEILEGGMDPSAAIMPWRGASALEVCHEAAKGGHNIVMAPSSFLYFNSSWPNNSHIERALTMEKVYSYNPIPDGLEEKYHQNIIGLEGCLWSEHTATFKDVEYQTMPRIAALSEVAWTKTEDKDFDDFTARLSNLYSIYKQMDINYYVPSPIGLDPKTVFTDKSTLHLNGLTDDLKIKYTTDGSEPTENSIEFTTPVEITSTTTIKATAFDAYGQPSKTLTGLFEKQDFRTAETVENLTPGIAYETYEGRFRGCALVGGDVVDSGTTETINCIVDNNAADAGAILKGYIKVPEKTVYTFSLSSDDGSVMYIDDYLVVNNDGYHGGKDRDGNLIFKSGKIALDAGLHPITIRYFDWGGGEMLKLFYAYGDMEKVEVSEDMLFVSGR